MLIVLIESKAVYNNDVCICFHWFVIINANVNLKSSGLSLLICILSLFLTDVQMLGKLLRGLIIIIVKYVKGFFRKYKIGRSIVP